jgi:uncharacterized protein YjbI with pentapeptide repeats
MLKKTLMIVALLAGGVGLSACGSTGTVAKFIAAKSCAVTATNFDLAGCDLAKKNLSHDDLQSDDLRNADLSGANLDFANLQGADLEGADVKGVTTNIYTICVNAEHGPCTKAILNSPSSSDAANN